MTTDVYYDLKLAATGAASERARLQSWLSTSSSIPWSINHGD